MIRALILCALVAGVGGAECPDYELYTEQKVNGNGELAMKIRDKCDPKAIVYADDMIDPSYSVRKTTFTVYEYELKRKIEKLEKRVAEIEKREQMRANPVFDDSGISKPIKTMPVPCEFSDCFTTQVGK